MFGSRFLLFWIILLTYLVAGTLYAMLTPNWQAPDEPAHYNYIHYLATKTGFPELVSSCYDQAYLNELTSRRFPADLSINSVCYEFHQPPVYYLLARPFFILSDGLLVMLRLVSVMVGAGVIVMAFFIAHTIFPDRDAIAYGTMAFVAFVPMHIAILASVNNDSLAELILAIILYLLVRRLHSSQMVSVKNDLLLGLVLGVGLLTKTTVYIAVPIIAAELWLEAKTIKGQQNQLGWSYLLKHAVNIYGLAIIVAVPWYIRNATIYGGFDILGLARHDEIVVGQLRTADLLTDIGGITYAGNFITTTFHSFWGQFGWMAVPMDNRTYLLLTVLTLVALSGLVAFWISSSTSSLSAVQRNALIIMALTVLLMILGYGWYNLTFVQFQGRYLFPSLIPLGLFFSLGLAEALNRRWGWWLAGGLTLALVWVAISSGLNGGLDKWAILIIGLALGLVLGRLWLKRHWSILSFCLLVACFAGLGLLTLAGPFWFIVPYL